MSIENITKDPGSSDMIADVYLEPIQFVTTPNGGEYHASGNDLVVTWRYRPVGVSGIATVDVGLSYDGGQSYPVEYTGQTNTGSFAFSGLSGMGDEFRVRVVSYDPIASAFDVSDADFTVWDILETSVSEAVTVMCENDREIVRINASWLTSVATDGLDELRVYRPSAQSCPSGQPSFTKTASPNGTSHQVIADSGCVTGLRSYVVTSTLGTGQTISNCYSFNVTEPASGVGRFDHGNHDEEGELGARRRPAWVFRHPRPRLVGEVHRASCRGPARRAVDPEWLSAGVLEDGKRTRSEVGTVQGGSVKDPILRTPSRRLYAAANTAVFGMRANTAGGIFRAEWMRVWLYTHTVR